VRLLLDTHALIRWLAGDPALSRRSRDAIAENPSAVAVSAASAWEIATKVRLGKLPGAAAIAHRLGAVLRREGFAALSISIDHAQRAGALPGPLRDPFDRMLIAQAILDDRVLVSIEAGFDRYGVTRLW
jgi:PIN domain nuclease of toxin-antitoxin system